MNRITHRVVKGVIEEFGWSDGKGNWWQVWWQNDQSGCHVQNGEHIPGFVDILKAKSWKEILDRGTDNIAFDYVKMLWEKQQAEGYYVGKIGKWGDPYRQLIIRKRNWSKTDKRQILISCFQGTWHCTDPYDHWVEVPAFNPKATEWKAVQRYAYRWLDKQLAQAEKEGITIV